MEKINPDKTEVVSIDHVPHVCPQCHHSIEPEILQHPYTYTCEDKLSLEIAFKCPKSECRSMFIGQYKKNWVRGVSSPDADFYLHNTTPKRIEDIDMPDEVIEISPLFKKIYIQADAAEKHRLNEISGLGYRTALECLVKDYCLYKHPDKEEEIISSPLGVVIKSYVDDPQVLRCAERTAWLENDEAHCIRDWEDKITELKILIKLTCNWMQGDILTEKYPQVIRE